MVRFNALQSLWGQLAPFFCAGLWDAVDVIQAEIASHAAQQLTPGAAGSSAAAADNLLSSWKPVLRPKKGLLFAYSEASPQCSEVFAQLSVLPRVSAEFVLRYVLMCLKYLLFGASIRQSKTLSVCPSAI